MCKFSEKFWKSLSKRNKSGEVVTQLYQMEWYELWSWLDPDELGSGKRRSFGEINKTVIFWEKRF